MCNDEEKSKLVEEKVEDVADFYMRNIKELGMFSYELEEKREQSLIGQATSMMTAFSIFTAALYMIVAIIVEFTVLSKNQILFSTAIISFILIISLLFAIFAQWRFKYNVVRNIMDIYAAVNNNYEDYRTQAQFDMQWMEQIKVIHGSKKKNNDKRVIFIKISMILFIIAISLLFIFAILIYIINI